MSSRIKATDRVSGRIEVTDGVTVTSVEIKDVLVIRGQDDVDDAFLKRLANELGCLVVHLPAGADVEMLDEDEMAQHGWVRKPQAS